MKKNLLVVSVLIFVLLNASQSFAQRGVGGRKKGYCYQNCESIQNPDAITGIVLKDQSLTQVPGYLSKFKNLTYLDLSHNHIRGLPEEIGNLRKLQFLILENNQLASLPESIAKLQNLKYLNVDENRLQSLPDGFDRLQNLQGLCMLNNPFQSLPEFLNNMKLKYILVDHHFTTDQNQVLLDLAAAGTVINGMGIPAIE